MALAQLGGGLQDALAQRADLRFTIVARALDDAGEGFFEGRKGRFVVAELTPGSYRLTVADPEGAALSIGRAMHRIEPTQDLPDEVDDEIVLEPMMNGDLFGGETPILEPLLERG